MFLLRVASWFLWQWKDVIKNGIILKMLIQCKSCKLLNVMAVMLFLQPVLEAIVCNLL